MRRIAIGASGFYVSPPGVDALGGYDDSILLFSPSLRHLMLVDSGVFQLAPNTVINFAIPRPLTSVPLIVCGPYNNQAAKYPVIWAANTVGFVASPQTKPDGSTPANGQYCIWQAFVRSRT